MIICCNPQCCCFFAILIVVSSLIVYIARLEFGVIRPLGCGCHEYSCGCDSTIELSKINGTLGVNFVYEPKDLRVSAIVTFNEETLLNETLSQKSTNCVDPIEQIIDYIQACVQLSDLTIYENQFSGCVNVKMYWMKIFTAVKKNLGCFKYSFNNSIQDNSIRFSF